MKTSRPPYKPRQTFTICLALYFIAFVHLLVQRCVFAASTSPQPLSELWQLPTVQFLRERPFESIWYWHAYAPGFVAWWALLIHCFPVHFEAAYQWLNVLGGATIAPASYLICLAACESVVPSILAAVIVGASPSLPLFSAYYIYDAPTEYLLTSVVALLAIHVLTGRRVGYLIIAVWMTAILICFRSFFHLLLLSPLLVWTLAVDRRLRNVVSVVLAASLPLIVYTKNWLMFGFFGASSMLGFNLSKSVLAPLPSDRIAAFAKADVISPMVAEHPLFYPLLHGQQIYRSFGYCEVGRSVLLNQNDPNNINLVGVAKEYEQSSIKAIRYRPRDYLVNIVHAYWMFCSLPSRVGWLDGNPAKIEPYRTIYLNVFYAEWFGKFLKRVTGSRAVPSIIMPLLPLLVIVFAARIARIGAGSPARWRAAIQERAILAACITLLAYAAILGSTLEYGENGRYFLYVEPLFVCVCVAGLVRAWRGVQLWRRTSLAHRSH